jgi:hypothetical protein
LKDALQFGAVGLGLQGILAANQPNEEQYAKQQTHLSGFL